MSVWQDHKPGSGSGDYLKLKDNDKKKVRFYTDPAVITYDGAKLRYQVVLYNKTDRVAQIFEFGPQIFGQVGDLYEDWGEPTEMDISIARKGSTQFDTEYTVNPVKESVILTKDEEEACKAIKFPSSKSKMLAQYEQDHIMPETIETSKTQNNASEPLPTEPGDIDSADIPF